MKLGFLFYGPDIEGKAYYLAPWASHMLGRPSSFSFSPLYRGGIWFLFETNLVDCHVLVITNDAVLQAPSLQRTPGNNSHLPEPGARAQPPWLGRRVTIDFDFDSYEKGKISLDDCRKHFQAASCAVNTVSYNIHEGQARIPLEKLPVSVSRCLPVLEITDLPSYLQGRGSESECSSLLTLFVDQFSNFREADWIFLNTSNTLEEEVPLNISSV
ncbi:GLYCOSYLTRANSFERASE [Salix koriyanagi]|uniref:GLYCOSYLTRANSFERASE n=1 Tax=Salix koriyanagi TaxID=2511006 RepID=A0A9Q0P3G2_9ROSI|nr:GLYCOSYLTRANSFERASE [Salix koriyanagi]